MLGLRGTKALGASLYRLASGGLTSTLALSTGLLLAACQVPAHHLKTANSAAPAQSQSAPAGPVQSEVSKPAGTPKQTPIAATPAVAHGDTIAPTATRLTGDPDQLIGLDHTTLRRVLGKPAQVRNEMTAQVWQYVTGECVVDLYLYEEDGGLKVTYVEARSRTADTTPTTRCLKSLLERPTASAN